MRMASTTSGPSDPQGGPAEIVGTFDGDGPSKEFVIADITEDEAWLAMRADETQTLPAWR